MLAGYAMLILALGTLVMVLCTGFGDAEDDREDPATHDSTGSQSDGVAWHTAAG